MKKPFLRHLKRALFCALFFLTGTVVPARADLLINLFAVNASETETREVEVKHYLPVELDPLDIVDTGPLKTEYDVDKGLYYVVGKFAFNPKESRVFKIKVKDVWYIESSEITILKDQLERNLEMMKDHENYSYALQMRDRISTQLEYVLKQQTQYSENIERRIEEYRAYVDMLNEIRNNVYSLDFLKHDAKALEEMAAAARVVKLIIEVKNPSEKDTKTVKHKHYLPSEVREEHLIDAKGFEVRFDEKKNRAYLIKEETFLPGESKRYEILLKDIWEFPMTRAEDLADRTMIAQGELQGTIYEDSGKYLEEKILQNIEIIKRSQEETGLPIRQHMGLFRANKKRYEEAWQDFKRIEEMIDIVRAKKLEELEKSKVKNILQRLKALRGLKAISEALFKKAISVTVTWRIIMGAIIFVTLFTTIHFFIWAKRSAAMGEEKGLGPGETVQVVPKPGEGKTEEEEEAEGQKKAKKT